MKPKIHIVGAGADSLLALALAKHYEIVSRENAQIIIVNDGASRLPTVEEVLEEIPKIDIQKMIQSIKKIPNDKPPKPFPPHTVRRLKK